MNEEPAVSLYFEDEEHPEGKTNLIPAATTTLSI